VLGGLKAWLAQRLTAAYLALYLIAMGVWVTVAPPPTVEAWRAWVLSTPVALATGLFFLALLLHAWVGVRDVVLDYVGPAWLRVAVLSAVLLALAAQALWVLGVLLGGRP
jgi:succinate dehydrogenase / fumarate reductase membrane anchor subunit